MQAADTRAPATQTAAPAPARSSSSSTAPATAAAEAAAPPATDDGAHEALVENIIRAVEQSSAVPAPDGAEPSTDSGDAALHAIQTAAHAVSAANENRPEAGIQSEQALAALVEAAGRDAQPADTHPSEQPQQHSAAPQYAPPQAAPVPRSSTLLGKRKAGQVLTVDQKHRLIRETVQLHLKSLSSLYNADGSAVHAHGPDGHAAEAVHEAARAVMTTVRCMHGSVAQKSYGSEKRFLCPPPVVRVSGALRYHIGNIMTLDLPTQQAVGGPTTVQPIELPSLSMNVISEDGSASYSEQYQGLDSAMHSRFRYLHVAGTGKSKNFRLQLNLLRPQRGKDGRPLAKQRKGDDSTGLDLAAVAAAAARKSQAEAGGYISPSAEGGSALLHSAGFSAVDGMTDDGTGSPGAGLGGAGGSGALRSNVQVNLDQVAKLVPMDPWASFESAPVGIISKPSRKSAKVRNTSSNIVSGSLIALYSRINSQTVRTKYMAVGSSQQHLVSLHGGWSAFRISLIARPPEASYASHDEDIITYGSVVILTDAATGCSTDPLVLCKVDRGKIYIPRNDDDETYYADTARTDGQVGSAAGGALGADGGAPAQARNASDAAATIQEIAERAAALAESSAAEMERAQNGDGGGNGQLSAEEQQRHDQIFAEAHAEALTAAGLQPPAGFNAPSGSGAPVPMHGAARISVRRTDEHNIFGAISQMQKVAFLRFEPRTDLGDAEDEDDGAGGPRQGSLDPDFDKERYYLTAMDYDRFGKDDGSGTVHAKGREQEATIYPPAEDYFPNENGINPAAAMESSVGAGGGGGPPAGAEPPLVYAPPPPILNGQPTIPKRNEDDIDDSFGWTMVGISQFEFSFFEAYGQPTSEDDSTLPITPFPIITSMPLYDARSHTLTTTALNFYYYPEESTGAAPALVPMEVWLGPLGPLVCRSKPRSDRTGGESEIAVELPALEAILETTREQRETARQHAAAQAAAARAASAAAAAVAAAAEAERKQEGLNGDAPSAPPLAPGTGAAAAAEEDDGSGHVPQYLPLLFVRGSDGTGYHSGRHIACEDIVSLMQTAGHDPSAADALHNLALHQPPGGPEAETWSLRVV